VSRTVYLTATSIDGFIADAANSLDWLFAVEGGDDAGEAFRAFLAGVGAMVMGATTYEWVTAHMEGPEGWREAHGDVPCWVMTHRRLAPVAGAALRFASGDVGAVHAEMRAAAAGRDIWVVGGGDLAGQLADRGLLDEVRLSVAPVTLGGGAPLLPRRLDAGRLELVSAGRRGPFAELAYRVAPPAG
jgi:dihydrofolate reductase